MASFVFRSDMGKYVSEAMVAEGDGYRVTQVFDIRAKDYDKRKDNLLAAKVAWQAKDINAEIAEIDAELTKFV